MRAAAANLVWLASLLPEAGAFRRAANDVAGTQARLLRAIVMRNRDTAFGRRHGFRRVRTVADFRAAVPLADYADLAPWVERIAAGEPNVLSRDPVRLLEPSSGSSAARKLVPYTKALQGAFLRGIAPWVADLFRHDPALLSGPAYWSVSPVAQPEERSPGGVPIGFEDDSGYLGGLGRLLRRRVLVAPAELRRIADVDAFRYATLLFLLRRPGVRLLSVWNPSFLTLLLDALPGWGEWLARDLERGTLSLTLPRAIAGRLVAELTPAPARAAALRRALAGSPDPAVLPAALWPQLRLLSCWTDANAAPYARELGRRFPGVRLQGKGLLATEGFVTLPLRGLPAPALAVRSHHFEFLDETGEPRLAHELAVGAEVEVVLTSDVFYRYRLLDRVRVAGFWRQLPLLRFVGKAVAVSDHVGEKLHEQHVRGALQAVFGQLGLEPRFALLACERRETVAAYQLFVEGVPAVRHAALAESVERALFANPNYAYCRRLGQLGPLAVVAVERGAQRYAARLTAAGQRAGDIKPATLRSESGWYEALAGVRS